MISTGQPSRCEATIFTRNGSTSEGRSSPGRRAGRRRLRRVFHLAQVRLRLPIVLIFAALVAGEWDVIRNYWGRLTRVFHAESIARQAVSNDTEYFCPMDPGVVSDWPSKCGVCNMALVRRKRGEALSLPDGVVARMQLSPNRIQLAGIQTVPASFRALDREYERTGLVSLEKGTSVVVVEIPVSQAAWITLGQGVSIEFLDAPGQEPVGGRVRAVAEEIDRGWKRLRATIEIKVSTGVVREGLPVVARFKAPVCGLEPFRSMPHDPPPLAAWEPRRVYVCANHPGTIALEPGNCPIDQNAREGTALLEHQRVRFWCPMHPAVRADGAGEKCSACGGMELQPARRFVPTGGAGAGGASVSGHRRGLQESGLCREYARDV